MDKKERKKITWKDFGLEKIILIAIAGIILLVVNFSEWKSKTVKEEESSLTDSSGISAADGNEAYIEDLENKLEHILENVDGVGRVEVMITLKSSKESILNKDSSEEAETEEETEEDTKKIKITNKKDEETILSNETGEAAHYVVKELEPEISGVIISCEGADNNLVAASVTEAAQVLFGISTNHIKVLKMEVQE